VGLNVAFICTEIVSFKVEDTKNVENVTKAIRASIASKQLGYADLMSPIIAKACTMVFSKSGKFNVDDVRVAKIPGGSITDMHIVKGVVIVRDADGTIKHVKNAKVGVFSSGIDYAATETKETFVVSKAEQLEGFASSQENAMEKIIKEIADSGVTVIVSGNKIGDMAMHFIEKYKMMAVKVTSKFELRRVCRTCGATPLLRLGAPTKEEIGTCDLVTTDEIGGTKVTVFKQLESTNSRISTIVCRGATDNILDDLERAIEDGVNNIKQLSLDARFVAGAGAAEIELARQLRSFGDATPGQDQYAIRKFAEALEIVPRTLAENGGHDATNVIAKLYAAHTADGKGQNMGVDVESGEVRDSVEAGVLDLFVAKQNALYLATNTAIDILRVDQLVMSKPAAGPPVRSPQGQDAGGPEF
jgi:T-complex protein 1 subunit theta